MEIISAGGAALRLRSARQVLNSSPQGNPVVAADRAAIRQQEHLNLNAAPGPAVLLENLWTRRIKVYAW